MEKINMKKFNEYVYEKLRIGLNDKQIATSLGMSLKHFHSILNGEENKKNISTATKNEEVKPKKPAESPKAAEKSAEEKKDDNFDWME